MDNNRVLGKFLSFTTIGPVLDGVVDLIGGKFEVVSQLT
jgi:hypothetical protein